MKIKRVLFTAAKSLSKPFLYSKLNFFMLLNPVVVQAEPDAFAMQTNAQVTKGCNMTDVRGKETAENGQGAIWMTKEQVERGAI